MERPQWYVRLVPSHILAVLPPVTISRTPSPGLWWKEVAQFKACWPHHCLRSWKQQLVQQMP